MLEFLTQSAWADRIGWVLVHSLWQFALVGLLAIGLQWALPRCSATTRYRALLAVMAIMVAIPVVTWFSPWSADAPVASAKFRPVENPENISPSQHVSPSQHRANETATAAVPAESPGESVAKPQAELQRREPATIGLASSLSLVERRVQPWLPEIVLVWFAGVLVAMLRPLLGWYMVRRLTTAGVSSVPDAVQGVLERTAARLKVARAVEVLQSTLVKTPVVVGYFRPAVLLPLCVVTGLPEVQLELILAHELAHIRRHDYLINLLQTLVETLFFYHPAVWWLSRQIRNERENCCDDAAMATVGSRADYGRALLAIEELRATSTALSLAARGGSLLARIRRVAGCEPAPRIAGGGSILCAILASIAIFAAVTWAAAPTAEKPEQTAAAAEAFGKLSDAEQRAVLVKAFQQRLEQGRNLFYETEQVYRAFESNSWEPGKPLRRYPYLRYLCRYWRLADSYKMEMFQYDDPKPVASYRYYSANAENAQQGVGRNVSIGNGDGPNTIQGQVVYPYRASIDDRFHTFPSPDDGLGSSGSQYYFFQYLVDKKDKFEIRSPVSGDRVQLIVPWRGGKQVFLLDPQKEFLPIRFDAGWEIPGSKDRKGHWSKVTFEVNESRLEEKVWMPVKMVRKSLSSKNILAIEETKILRVERGTVKPADLLVPFTEGMKVADIIEGLTYTADAQGNAVGPVKDAPDWKHDPPKGWYQGQVEEAYSMASRISAADRKTLAEAREAKSKPIDEGLKVLRADPPATQEQRIEASLKILRAYRVGEREGDWATAIRQLITIGKPAVPKLIEELDRTDNDRTLRAMGFVLRGIGDPRALPALIRAIPRLTQPPSSDHGVTIKNDPELLQFMWMHDIDHVGNKKEKREGNGLILFSYERPIREIMSALEKLTGQSLGWRELDPASMKADGVIQLRRQRMLFLDHAKKWDDWWSHNWKQFVPQEADAQLDRTKQSIEEFAEKIAQMPQPSLPMEIPCGPLVKVDEGVSYHQFEPYVNLDVGRKIPRPEELLRNSPKDHPSPELLAWATQKGVNLLRIEIKRPGDGKTYYGYQPVGMKVWKIDNKRLTNLEKELQESKKLDLPPLWEGPISSVDRQEGDIAEEKPATFLFITREGTCGTMQIRSALFNERMQGANPYGPPVFEYREIYEGVMP